jgi:hypothetical protein
MPEPGTGEGSVQPDQEQAAPRTASGESYDVVADRINPPKTIPQFKMLTMDPLGEVASGKGIEPKATGGDDAEPKTWPDGNPVVDRGGSTEPDELPDGQPSDQVSDIDKAIDMAKAGDQLRSDEAYLKQNAKLKEEERSGEWSTSRAKNYDEKREELAKKYKSSTSGSLTHSYRNYESDTLREKAEEVASEAERLEFWAGEIHERPDLAGELTPQQCVNIENWLFRNELMPDNIDSDIERLMAQDEGGELTVARVVQEFQEYFGRDNGRSEVHKRFRELTSKNDTTVGEIKQFLFDEMGKSAEGWRNVIDVNRQKLAAVQGK